MFKKNRTWVYAIGSAVLFSSTLNLYLAPLARAADYNPVVIIMFNVIMGGFSGLLFCTLFFIHEQVWDLLKWRCTLSFKSDSYLLCAVKDMQQHLASLQEDVNYLKYKAGIFSAPPTPQTPPEWLDTRLAQSDHILDTTKPLKKHDKD